MMISTILISYLDPIIISFPEMLKASYLMLVLDVSIVITALPKLKASLNFSDTGLSWVQNAYTLTFGGFLLLGARAGDILGRRRMYILGQSIFIIASLAIVVAQSAEWMLISRAVQGIGAAILAPSTLSLLATNFPEGTARTRAMAYYASAARMAFLPTTIVNFIVGISVPKLARRFSNSFFLTAGLTMTMLGMAWLSYACAEQSAFLFLSLPMVLIGAGQGMVLAPLTVSGVKGVAHEDVDVGAASGITLLIVITLIIQPFKQKILNFGYITNQLD